MANETIQIEIDLKNIEEFYQSAIVRLSYLYPSLNFDFKDNKIFIYEINPRFSSTVAVRSYFGLNEPLLSLIDSLGHSLDEYIRPTLKGKFHRYWEERYWLE